MSEKQRVWLAEGLRELANLAIAGLAFGQIISGKIDSNVALVGLIVGAFCYVVGFELMKKSRKKGKRRD